MIEWEVLRERIQKLEHTIEVSLATLLIPLLNCPKIEGLPDYFGQALNGSTQACFDSIAFGRDDQFERMFPVLFIAALMAVERAKKELTGYSQEASILVSTEPVENLMELSGYAMIYSEIGTNKLWATTKGVWDKYFSGLPDAAGAAKYLGAVLAFRKDHLGLNPGDMQRSGWKQYFEHDMRKRGLLEDSFSSGNRGKRTLHASPIVRALLRGGHMFSDLSDVFIVAYLQAQPFGAAVPTARRTESYADALKREIARGVPSEEEE